jgi:UDP-N-acetylglucosamine 2-epimerase
MGTRPEVIKLAPVVSELRRCRRAECLVVSSGQHREMLDQMLEQFELEVDVDLDVMRPAQRLADTSRRACALVTSARRFRRRRTGGWSPGSRCCTCVRPGATPTTC